MAEQSEHTLNDEGKKDALSRMFRALFPPETRSAAFKMLWKVFRKYVILTELGGIGIAALFAVGQIWSIGFHAAWKVYKYWWILSPLVAPALLSVTILPSIILEAFGKLIDRTLGPQHAVRTKGLLIVVGAGTILIWVGYVAAREDNPMLNSQPANMEALSKSIGEQKHVLGEMSESGKVLLDQLNATEIELENAKKQLTATLTNFDVQRQAAGQVTEELKRIDARQKQIALQTEELQRILEGQQPITRHDLQRANLQGLGFGLVIGFIGSFLASMAYSAIGKKRPVTG